jgi:hypothetical protein
MRRLPLFCTTAEETPLSRVLDAFDVVTVLEEDLVVTCQYADIASDLHTLAFLPRRILKMWCERFLRFQALVHVGQDVESATTIPDVGLRDSPDFDGEA